jgi:EmrB/QacA subfamily drug resistance transporter
MEFGSLKRLSFFSPAHPVAALTTGAAEAAPPWNLRRILIGLMVPMGMTVLNMSMFSIGLPSIRSNFAIQPDLVAWLVTAYTLPFVIFMPLYGRLGDGLGKRRLFLMGLVIFALGTFVAMFASNLWLLMIGRIVQGIGTAGVNPLCIAIISDFFPAAQRGKALGTWSSAGPAISMVGPFLGGFLVDHWGWQAIFIPALLAGVVSIYVVWGQLPASDRPIPQGFLRKFDWIGLLLLSGAIVTLIFYLSSRPITGVEPLQDWRLLLLLFVLLALFYGWEKRHPEPLVDLQVVRYRNFSRASFCALLRMVLMNGEGFLTPLFFTDAFGLSASWIGVIGSFYSGALLSTTRWAGKLADRGNGRWLITTGFAIQGSMLATLALLPNVVTAPVAAGFLLLFGMGAGFSLAVLSHSAMAYVPVEQSGTAAGLHSTIRFLGGALGITLCGVLLRQMEAQTLTTIDAYQMVYGCLALVGLLGVLLAWRLR